ncbi:hypothetical protein R1sor_022893 [Riccia sorocarpa]|uniref:A-kinase anchor protein 2 C-terminal domain-containing protein n=1 Tax=Riccia sorocarpa TaxID=122646 RepID=A0ABD3GL65_9MARC
MESTAMTGIRDQLHKLRTQLTQNRSNSTAREFREDSHNRSGGGTNVDLRSKNTESNEIDLGCETHFPTIAESRDFRQVTSRSKQRGAAEVENLKGALAEKSLRQKTLEENLAANPFHALAGAFETDSMEITDETEEPNRSEASERPPLILNSVIKPTPERIGNAEQQKGMHLLLTPEPVPSFSRARNLEDLTSEELTMEIQRVKEKTLHELYKSRLRLAATETCSPQHEEEKNQELHDLLKPEPERTINAGVNWAEIVNDSDEEHEHGGGDQRKTANSAPDSSTKLEQNVGTGSNGEAEKADHSNCVGDETPAEPSSKLEREIPEAT